jgi:hypothetical protein
VFRLEVADIDVTVAGIEDRWESRVDEVFYACVLSHLLNFAWFDSVFWERVYFCSLAASFAESEFHSRPFFEWGLVW